MAIEVNNDLETFHRFIAEQLKNGGPKLSPEQVLAMWRERPETIRSVRRGLEDVEAGRTAPAKEVVHELRQELQQDT